MCKKHKWFRLPMVASFMGASTLCLAAVVARAADGDVTAEPAPMPPAADVAPAAEAPKAEAPVAEAPAAEPKPETPAAEAPKAEAPAAAEPAPADVQPSELATREELQRKEAKLVAEEYKRQGLQAYKAKKFKEALEFYSKAEEKLGKVSKSDKAVLKEIEQIHKWKADINAEWAEALALEGRQYQRAERFDEAIARCREAYMLDPLLKDEMQALVSDLTEEKQTAEYTANVNPESVDTAKPDRELSIRVLMEQGRVLLENHRYADARDCFEKVLIKDPTDLRAIRYLRQIDGKLHEAASERRINMQARRLAETDWKWIEPINPTLASSMADNSTKPVPKDQATGTSLRDKLHSIRIPSLDFEDATIAQVMLFLKQRSKELDPQGVGINFILYSPQAGGAGAAAAAPAVPALPEAGAIPAVPEAGAAPGGLGGATAETGKAADFKDRRVTISMTDVPLDDAIKYICMSADLQFKVDRNAVLIADRSTQIETMEIQFFPVTPQMVEKGIKTAATNIAAGGGLHAPPVADAGGAAGGDDATSPESLRRTFEAYGVPFPAGATISYNATISKIVAKNTDENLQKLKNVLDQLNVDTEQVSIETKFVEVGLNDLSEFGFDWAVGLNPKKAYHNAKYNVFNQTWNTPQDTSQLVPNGIPIPAGFNPTTLNDLAPYYRGTLDNAGNFTPQYQTVAPDSTTTTRMGNGLRGAATAFSGVNALDEVIGVRSILGSYQLDTILRALSQSGSSNMLAAPKVTAMSGNEAVIEMVQKRYFPTRWEAPSLNAQGGGQNNAGNLQQNVSSTPSSPEFGEPTNIGVMLHVTPTVRDQFVINLKLKPEVVEFLGYDKELNQVGTLGNQPYLFKFEMPIIESRSVDTQVEVNDGETLVLGGFIREDAQEYMDKVPILGDIPLVGRLFQTKGSKNTKRNLLIFVTARLIKANGVPKRTNNEQGTIDFNR